MVGLAASDIPMAPGMAGALVADIEGDVVGMILPVSSSPFTAGVATYFIPSRTLFDVSSAIISTGVSGKPWLGLIAETTSSGLVVKTVLPDSPAESAGILEGEVLLDFNAIPVTSPLSLATAVQTAEIDSLVRINGVVSGQPVLHLLRLSVPPSTGSVLDDSSTDDDDE
jgi:S1-C subfamily serine protease